MEDDLDLSVLTEEQLRRAEAIDKARKALVTGSLLGTTNRLRAKEVIKVARWIMDGDVYEQPDEQLPEVIQLPNES